MQRIDRKSRHEISLIRIAARINVEAHLAVAEAIRPGISTQELNDIAERVITKAGGLPAFKGMYGFPATLCTSVNEEIVHGVPKAEKILQEGDIISIDCGTTYKGMVSDSAITWPVGTITTDLERLLKTTEESLMAGIMTMRPGKYLDDIGTAIEAIAKRDGFGLVRSHGGHGVGRKLHEAPFVANYPTGEPGPQLEAGNVLAIEPMFTLGGDEVEELDDGTVLTRDRSYAAHFEHTVAITENGPEILTLLPP